MSKLTPAKGFLRWKPERLMAEIDRWARNRVLRCIQIFERELQEMFRAPKTGRIYGAETTVTWYIRSDGGPKRFGSKVTFVANRGKKLNGKGKSGTRVHQASAPGEAPAIDMGRLRQSVAHKIDKLAFATYAGYVGTNVKYALWLEFGTKRMAARPAWIPALLKTIAAVGEVMADKGVGGA